jgi:hypothetical protein
LVERFGQYFREVRAKDQKYVALIGDTDKPQIRRNADKMAR